MDFHHPYLAEANKMVMTMAEKRGIPMMDMPWPNYNIEDAKVRIRDGVRIMLYYVDVFLFLEICQNLVRRLKESQ